MDMETKMDSSSTQDEGTSDSTDSNVFSVDSIDLWESSEYDRIVQVSVPDYQGHLFSAIRAAHKNGALTDASLVVGNKTFSVHRLIISAFSNKLREFFSKESAKVFVVKDIDPNIISIILDFIYGNMAIVKESMLPTFLKAARQLEIEQLQTPGLLKLEQNVMAQKRSPDSNISSDETQCLQILEQNLLPITSCPNRSIESPHDVTQHDTAALELCLPSSVSIKILGKNACKITRKEFISEMKGDKVCKDKSEAKVGNEYFNKSNEERKTHWCCCKKSSEWSQTKEKGADKENDDEIESLKMKLKECGTVVVAQGINNLKDIPERLLSSSDISLTPVKLPNKVSTTKRKSCLSKKIITPTSPQLPLPDTHASKINSNPSKCSSTKVRRNLQNRFHAEMYQQKEVTSGFSSNNRNYNSGGIIGSKIGPLMAGFKGHSRKYLNAQIQESILCPAFRHYFNHTSKSQNICMQEYESNKRIVSGQSRGKLNTNKMFQFEGGNNKLLQSVSRGDIYSVRQDPTSPTRKGRALHSEAKSTPAENADNLPVNKTSEPTCGTPKNSIFWNGKESLNFDDSGNIVQTSDTATQLIQDSFCLKADVDLNNLPNLEFENTQLHGKIIVTSSQNSYLEVESFQSQELQKSENTNKLILPQPQEQPSSPSCEHQATIRTMPSDTANKPGLSVKPSMMRKQRKQFGRPKSVQRCIVCRKVFSSHSLLIMHMCFHSGENSFHCTSCDYRTALFNTIKTHVLLNHKRLINESEGKRHHASDICPSQVSENPAKIEKFDHL
ncbi:uncharacterized protein [Procambarus clarkii]|uniref:uncharacterized protein n=1 Tax=Procambarus clarkii TaxID=6728 RepID=UPI0037436E09